MRVVATAGHVDHGKSTLVRALTGMEPDRWAEERRRGMTIDLGYAWTALDPSRPDEHVAFVDVPGHQRFVTNMLAGVGPVPAVLLVIAGDAGWSRQTSEHLDAITALGIRHVLVAVTRADLATAEQLRSVAADARSRLAAAGLGPVDTVAVSPVSGMGLSALRLALRQLLDTLPEPRTSGRVRLWVDRAFTVSGAGTVLTGTLGAGRIARGDELSLHGTRYPVRGLQQLGAGVDVARAVSRVAVNLRGLDRDRVGRGDCLTTPGQWHVTDTVDVVFDPLLAEPAGDQVLHIGSASIPVRLRLLGADAARLTLSTPIPVEVGDRAVLRDPGQQSVTAGVRVLDPDPPALTRRGDATTRGDELLAEISSVAMAKVRRQGPVRVQDLARFGYQLTDLTDVVRVGDWVIDPVAWARWQTELTAAVDRAAIDDPRRPWLPVEAARQALRLPDAALVLGLAGPAGLVVTEGQLGRAGTQRSLGAAGDAMSTVVERLRENPFAAPERNELTELGLSARDLATAARAGLVLRLSPDLVIASDALERAVEVLAGLPQPFTAGAARQALGTTRRVAIPLLELLDRRGSTVLDADGGRTVAV